MNGFWIGVAIALLLFAWRGWRLGLVRSLLGLLALAAGGLVGWFFGAAISGVLGSALPWPPVYGQIGVAAALAVGAYLVAAIFSGLLLKKTKDHESSWIRGIFGLGGALVGLATGALIAAAGIWVIQFSHSDPEAGKPGSSQSAAVVPSLDATQRVLEKVMRVTANPKAMERFVEYPGVQDLVAHPKIVELTSDPDVNEAALKKNYVALFSNPKVLKALTDPTLVRELQRVELEKALDYSLKPPPKKE